MQRRIDFGASANHYHFPSNYVSTTRYKLWTIVPLNLFEQFHRFANIWFLIVSILQMLPFKISPTTSWATLVPLVGVLFVTFCKDAYEDLKRWRDDCRVNNQTCKVSKTSEDSSFKMVKWSEVAVGSLLKLYRDQPVPADLLLLFSSSGGGAFVDTAQLDGESALKPKQALDETQHMINHSGQVEGHLEADVPNQFVTKFDGCLYLKGYPRGSPVHLKNLLLRGSTLRNTGHIIALVVYTGKDTKMVRNSSRSLTSKRSQVELLSNKLLAIIFLLLFVISIGSAIARAHLIADEQGFANLSWVWPLTGGNGLQDNPYMAILTFLIGYNNLIPISLYMTTDLVRAMQAFLMERDESMYDKEADVACTVRSSSLCEDLGQVDFVLSDKTGTLTQNRMCFKACYVDGQVYGYWAEVPSESEAEDADGDASMCILGHPSNHIERVPPRSVCLPLSPALWNVDADQDPIYDDSEEPLPAEGSTIENFFLCLATCHEAVPERKANAGSKLGELEHAMQHDPGMANLHLESDVQKRLRLLEEAQNTAFRSPSPDEEALLGMARDFGFFFQRKRGNQMIINIRGEEVRFTVLLVNEFSSDRKRMSVLVHRALAGSGSPDIEPTTRRALSMEDFSLGAGQYLLFAKGADTVMMERMATGKSRLGSDYDRSLASEGQQSRGLNFRGEVPLKPPAPKEPAPLLQLPDSPGIQASVMASLKSRSLSQYSGELSCHASNAGLSSWSGKAFQPTESMLSMSSHAEQKLQKRIKIANDQLRHFSHYGLRTLVCGYRELSDADAQRFVKDHSNAKASLFNREEKVAQVVDEMERGFSLLGITAVEDKIQVGVPETVKMLLDGGVRVWMLTGDSVETAVNIAGVCRLVPHHCKVFYLTLEVDKNKDSDPKEELTAKLRKILDALTETEEGSRKFVFSLVVNGMALYTILDESAASLKRLFATVACNSCSVIACRLAPAQKAALVELLQKEIPGNPLTLAVGDGGNDVSMIQKAHVGVGIYGAEGREAVNASDFAIGQFRFLRSLLFLHGRSNIRRIGIVIGYSFYKNFLLVICMACFAPWNGLSGTTFYDSYLIMMYNMIFTSIPIFIVGSLDVDTYAPAAFALPKLYLFGANQAYFNYRMLVAWLFRGIVHALVNFFVAVLLLGGLLGHSGHFADYLSLGTWSYWSCVVVANSTLLLHSRVWMDWQLFIAFASVMMFPPALFIYSSPAAANLFNPSFQDVAFNLFQTVPGWLALALVLALSVLVELAMDAWRRVKRPDMITRVQEVQGSRSRKLENPRLQPSGSKSFGGWDGANPELEVDKLMPSNLARETSVFSASLAVSPTSKPVRSQSVPAMSGFGTTRTGLDSAQKTERLRQLYPAALVSSVPWSYSKGSETYDVEDYRAEAAVLRGHAGAAWHPAVKQPGLRLLLEAILWLQGEGGGGKALQKSTLGKFKSLSQGRLGLAVRWQARLSHLQWCQIVLMFHDLDKDSPAEATKSQGLDDVATKLHRKTGMQKELFHLELLEQQQLTREESLRWTNWRDAEQPTRDSATRRYTTDFEYNIFNLQFRSKFHEEAFCRYFDEVSRKHFFVSIRLMTWVIVVGFQFVQGIALLATPLKEGAGEEEQWEKFVAMMRISLIICGSIIGYHLVLLPLRFSCVDVQTYVAFGACVLIVGKHVYERSTGEHGEVSDAIMPLFLVAGVRMRFPMMVLVLVLHMLVLLVYNTFLLSETACVQDDGQLQVSVCDSNNILRGEYMVIQFNVVLLVVAYTYVSERFARFNFAWADMISTARGSDRDILKGMYPEDVVEAVRTSFLKNQGEKLEAKSVSSTETIFQDRGIVTVVFIDIYDFGKVVAGLHPCDLVMMLDRVFALMDKVCQEHGVVKIETVGKTFMFAGLGDDSPNREVSLQIQAVKCLETAWAILQQFTKSNLGLESLHIQKLSLKIGINTGNVISGVVGSQKPQFALFGDTINTASRMMATGEVDRIHISAETYELVRHHSFSWHQQEIFAKGKGKMTTYLLEKGKSPTSMPRVETTATAHRRQSDAADASFEGDAQTAKWGLDFTFTFTCRTWPQRFRELVKTNWIFCCKVYERDSRKTSEKKSLVASLLLFWICFCLESCFIITGATGSAAVDLDFILRVRGSFALVSFFLLCVCTLVLFRVHLQSRNSPQVVRYLEKRHSEHSEIAPGPSVESKSNASAHSEDKAEEEEEAPEGINAITDEPWEEPSFEVADSNLPYLMHFLFTGLPVSLVFAGYGTAVVSNVWGIAGGDFPQVAYWLYYESIFYVSAMMYLNVFRVSLIGLACGVLMLFPATIAGIRADWPGGAIYPLVVLILHLKVVQDLKHYQLKGLEDLKMVEKEHAECESLLNSLLPKEVLSSMQSNTLQLAYTYRDMTMLFADIVGFTGYCNKHKDNPSDAVRLVTHLFASFDDCCKLLGAYKVCTIGDAYLAVNEPKTEHDDRVLGAIVLLHLAMAMLRIIVKVRDEVRHEGLNMRIGLHHGEFVAGVIGSNQLRFDIWGEDVLIGNQMESNGEPGRICCSATFVEVLKDFKDFSFTPHELIECAGSTRTLQSYLLDAPHGTGQGRLIESPRAQRGRTFRQISPKSGRRG